MFVIAMVFVLKIVALILSTLKIVWQKSVVTITEMINFPQSAAPPNTPPPFLLLSSFLSALRSLVLPGSLQFSCYHVSKVKLIMPVEFLPS